MFSIDFSVVVIVLFFFFQAEDGIRDADVTGVQTCALPILPVLILTAKDDEEDRIKGLELGADDYIGKPFSHRELVSRIRAVLRRHYAAPPTPQTTVVVDDRLTIDFARREVLVNGERVNLRPTEYRLLYHLVQNAGYVMPHEQLLTKVWGPEYGDETHYLRLYITYLRQKIEEDPANPKYILTERGIGYRFVDFSKSQQDAVSRTQ